MLSIIVARDRNDAIGINNKLPWYIPEDLEHFKEKTIGKTVIMGRKTYESIGKPLPNRLNIVLSTKDIKIDGCHVTTLDEIIKYDMLNPKEERFIIGGSEIYDKIMPFVSKIYLTEIFKKFEADSFFRFNYDDFEIIDIKNKTDFSNLYNYCFLELVRRKQ